MKTDKNIEQFFSTQRKFQSALLKLRDIILKTELVETIKWGMPVYTISNKNVAGIGAFKEHFGVWFFQGALLADEAGKLINAQEGKTVAMRQMRFTDEQEIEEHLLLKYLEEAIENQKAGREIKPAKPIKKLSSIPNELIELFEKSDQLKTSFDKLSPGKQKEYAEYISTAKREKTKMTRIEKISPMILQGKGLNDKYT